MEIRYESTDEPEFITIQMSNEMIKTGTWLGTYAPDEKHIVTVESEDAR